MRHYWAEYTIYRYKGKQVRDQIHSRDVARLFYEFYMNPRIGEVYNLGGGRGNSLSILETIDILEQMGYRLRCTYNPRKSGGGSHLLHLQPGQDPHALSKLANGIRHPRNPLRDC